MLCVAESANDRLNRCGREAPWDDGTSSRSLKQARTRYHDERGAIKPTKLRKTERLELEVAALRQQVKSLVELMARTETLREQSGSRTPELDEVYDRLVAMKTVLPDVQFTAEEIRSVFADE